MLKKLTKVQWAVIGAFGVWLALYFYVMTHPKQGRPMVARPKAAAPAQPPKAR